MYRCAGGQTDGYTVRKVDSQMDIKADALMCRQTDRQANRLIHKCTNSQADRLKNVQTDR